MIIQEALREIGIDLRDLSRKDIEEIIATLEYEKDDGRYMYEDIPFD